MGEVPDGQGQVVWRHTLELAEPFDRYNRFTVLFDVLRTAGYDTGAMGDALVLGRSMVHDHPADLMARRACRLLERSIHFIGGNYEAVGTNSV